MLLFPYIFLVISAFKFCAADPNEVGGPVFVLKDVVMAVNSLELFVREAEKMTPSEPILKQHENQFARLYAGLLSTFRSNSVFATLKPNWWVAMLHHLSRRLLYLANDVVNVKLKHIDQIVPSSHSKSFLSIKLRRSKRRALNAVEYERLQVLYVLAAYLVSQLSEKVLGPFSQRNDTHACDGILQTAIDWKPKSAIPLSKFLNYQTRVERLNFDELSFTEWKSAYDEVLEELEMCKKVRCLKCNHSAQDIQTKFKADEERTEPTMTQLSNETKDPNTDLSSERHLKNAYYEDLEARNSEVATLRIRNHKLEADNMQLQARIAQLTDYRDLDYNRCRVTFEHASQLIDNYDDLQLQRLSDSCGILQQDERKQSSNSESDHDYLEFQAGLGASHKVLNDLNGQCPREPQGSYMSIMADSRMFLEKEIEQGIIEESNLLESMPPLEPDFVRQSEYLTNSVAVSDLNQDLNETLVIVDLSKNVVAQEAPNMEILGIPNKLELVDLESEHYENADKEPVSSNSFASQLDTRLESDINADIDCLEQSKIHISPPDICHNGNAPPDSGSSNIDDLTLAIDHVDEGCSFFNHRCNETLNDKTISCRQSIHPEAISQETDAAHDRWGSDVHRSTDTYIPDTTIHSNNSEQDCNLKQHVLQHEKQIPDQNNPTVKCESGDAMGILENRDQSQSKENFHTPSEADSAIELHPKDTPVQSEVSPESPNVTQSKTGITTIIVVSCVSALVLISMLLLCRKWKR